jgi:RimJ/RimL family protein N-acetyltransferase
MTRAPRIEVRAATAADVPGVVALHAAVAAEGRWLGTEAPVDTDRFAAIFQRAIEDDDSQLFVAVDGGTVVGNLGVHPIATGIVSLGMSLAATHRGRGLGAALMAAAIEWSHQHGAHKMELEVWPHNTAAMALYRKCGFEDEGLRRRHYRRRNGDLWDIVVMGLVLDHDRPGGPPQEWFAEA